MGDESFGASLQIGEVEGGEFGSAQGTTEADQEQRSVSSATEIVRESSGDPAHVTDEQWGGLLWGSAERSPDA